MSINAARIADQKGLIPDAIRLYEELVASGVTELIDYLNLIVIYFNCLDFGYASAVKVDREVEKNCSNRALQLIDIAELKFGFNDELTFWRAYIPFLGWGDEIGKLQLRGDSLIPYVYLARENPTEENIQKAKQLYKDIEKLQGSQRRELFMSKLEIFLK